MKKTSYLIILLFIIPFLFSTTPNNGVPINNFYYVDISGYRVMVQFDEPKGGNKIISDGKIELQVVLILFPITQFTGEWIKIKFSFCGALIDTQPVSYCFADSVLINEANNTNSFTINYATISVPASENDRVEGRAILSVEYDSGLNEQGTEYIQNNEYYVYAVNPPKTPKKSPYEEFIEPNINILILLFGIGIIALLGYLGYSGFFKT